MSPAGRRAALGCLLVVLGLIFIPRWAWHVLEDPDAGAPQAIPVTAPPSPEPSLVASAEPGAPNQQAQVDGESSVAHGDAPDLARRVEQLCRQAAELANQAVSAAGDTGSPAPGEGAGSRATADSGEELSHLSKRLEELAEELHTEAQRTATTPENAAPVAAPQDAQRQESAQGTEEEAPHKRQRGRLTVGVLGPLTGPRHNYGFSHRRGIELAVEEVYRQELLPEVDVELVFANDRGDAQRAQELVERMIEEGMGALLSATTSECTRVAQRAAHEAQIPLITLGCAEPLAEGDGPGWTFRWQGDEGSHARKLAKWMFFRKHYLRVGVLCEDSPFGREGARQLRAAAAEYGMVAAAQVTFSRGREDFGGPIDTLVRARVEAVVVWAEHSDAARFVRQAREAKCTFALLGCDALATDEFARLVGDAGEGMIVACSFDPKAPSRGTRDFAQQYEARYLRPPTSAAAHGYDALWLVAHAARTHGTAPEQLREGIMRASAVSGATGPLAFDDSGLSRAEPMLYILGNGRLAPL